MIMFLKQVLGVVYYIILNFCFLNCKPGSCFPAAPQR
uniref:Uncharacterized protein n=1 Tax=Rhizophora mucronata TaxID=61149 RepID=A0A2P2NRR9_RHIMU